MKNLSRTHKLLICLVLLIASLFFIAVITGWPSPTLQIAIHRAEKQQLVGPGEIIDKLNFKYSNWHHLVLSKTKYGYTTYEYRDDLGWDNGSLTYYPREEHGTLFCTYYGYRSDDEEWLPMILIPDHPNTSRANLSLVISVDGETRGYQLESTRYNSGFYLFRFPMEEKGGKHFMLLQQAITGAYSEYIICGTVEIEVDFYDHSGSLVDNYAKTVTK